MTGDAALRDWQRRIFWCHARYRSLVAIVVCGWGITFVRAVHGAATGQWLLLVGLLPVGVSLTILTVLYRRQFRYLSSPGVTPLPPPQHELVAPLVADMAARLGAQLPRGIELLLDRRRLDAVPGISRWRGKTQLLLPVGFFQVLDQNPRVAHAMLAHELGHVRQGDLNAGAWVAAYARFFRFWSWPVIVFFGLSSAVSTLAFSTFIRHSSRQTERMAELRALEELHAEAENGYQREMKRYYAEAALPASPPPRRPVIVAPAPSPRRGTMTGPNRLGWTMGGFITGALFAFIVVVLFLAAFRALRRWSENAADLGAALLVGPDAVIAAITANAGSTRPPTWFEAHPTAAGRASLIARTFSATTAPPRPA